MIKPAASILAFALLCVATGSPLIGQNHVNSLEQGTVASLPETLAGLPLNREDSDFDRGSIRYEIPIDASAKIGEQILIQFKPLPEGASDRPQLFALNEESLLAVDDAITKETFSSPRFAGFSGSYFRYSASNPDSESGRPHFVGQSWQINNKEVILEIDAYARNEQRAGEIKDAIVSQFFPAAAASQ